MEEINVSEGKKLEYMNMDSKKACTYICIRARTEHKSNHMAVLINGYVHGLRECLLPMFSAREDGVNRNNKTITISIC